MKFFLLLRWKLSFLDTLQDSNFAHMKKFIKSVHLWLLWKTTEMLNCHQSNWNCLSDINQTDFATQTHTFFPEGRVRENYYGNQ